MVNRNTKQIRVLSDGKFQELIELVSDQFQNKHGFTPCVKEICEVIARAVMDNKLF